MSERQTEKRFQLPTIPFAAGSETPRSMLNLHLSDEVVDAIENSPIPLDIARSVVGRNIRRRHAESIKSYKNLQDHQDAFKLKDRAEYNHYANLRIAESDPDHHLSMRDKARFFVDGKYMPSYEIYADITFGDELMRDRVFATNCLRKIAHATTHRVEIEDGESLPKVRKIVHPLGAYAIVVVKRTIGSLKGSGITFKSRKSGVINMSELTNSADIDMLDRLDTLRHNSDHENERTPDHDHLSQFIEKDDNQLIIPLIRSHYLSRDI